jgi:flagellar protein FlgJ
MSSLDTSAAISAVNTSAATSAMGQLSGFKGKHMTEAQIDATSKDFESMFISQMLEPMFGDSVGAGAFGSSESDDIYKSMMMSEYGKKIAAGPGIGIASSVKRELMKLQEVQS